MPNYVISDSLKTEIEDLIKSKAASSLERLSKILEDNDLHIDAKEGSNGLTILHFAAIYGNTDVIKYCLENGANINAQTSSLNTPLILAIINQYIEAFDMLMKAKPELDITNTYKTTALMHAIAIRSFYFTEELVKAGADIDIINNSGDNALTLALRKGFDVKIIINAGRAIIDDKEETPENNSSESDSDAELNTEHASLNDSSNNTEVYRDLNKNAVSEFAIIINEPLSFVENHLKNEHDEYLKAKEQAEKDLQESSELRIISKSEIEFDLPPKDSKTSKNSEGEVILHYEEYEEESSSYWTIFQNCFNLFMLGTKTQEIFPLSIKQPDILGELNFNNADDSLIIQKATKA